MAAFSRLQLAAALLEYDNDPTNPDAPQRSAHESAIFAHLRRINGRRKTDYLGVSIPSEPSSLGRRESRRSRSSIDALRNPFGVDETVDGHDDDEEELEVDLASWGLDSFIPKEKGSSSSKKRAKLEAFPNPHTVPSLRRRPDTETGIPQRRTPGTRSVSLGYNTGFGAGGAFLDAQSSGPTGSPPQLAHTDAQYTYRQCPASVHGLIEQLPIAPPLHSIPFPTVSPRSASPPPDENVLLPRRRYSDLDPTLRPHETAYSSSTWGLRNDENHNPFSINPPSPRRASRFDPKSNHARISSNATMATGEENLRPSSRASKFDIMARTRTMSSASLGSRAPLDYDGGSVITGQMPFTQGRPYSTLELMRPKVLVMPSPLQPVTDSPSPPPPPHVISRDGFRSSVDGPPLPPGARTARRRSAAGAATEPTPPLAVPIASNSFTPNPRMSLTLSQLTFRNTLVVGGERDVAYSDLDRLIPRATEDGEQIRPESPIEELPEPDPVVEEEPGKPGRPAGKLFGKSLIDDLENRKAQMRGKQRVFTGDERASMMARAHRSGTLIDPATLHARPMSQHMNSSGSQGFQQALGRKNTLSLKPLLNFDGGEQPVATSQAPDTRVVNARSIFGVDTIWEREMAKLREIEARERLEADEMQKQEESKQTKKGKGRKKGQRNSKDNTPEQAQDLSRTEPVVDRARVSLEPPVLPSIQKATTPRRPPSVGDDQSGESDESDEIPQPGDHHLRDIEAEHWLAGSSDEENNGPRRTTGTGPRYPKATARSQMEDEDSEEDLPLSLTVERAMQRVTGRTASSGGSDEEKPLSILIQKAKRSLPSTKSNNSQHSKLEIPGDDDDQPLGLRASMAPSPSQMLDFVPHQDQDDDKPLALHPEQQRRTQYQMMAQHQQMMMQAQLHNSMFFGAPPGLMDPRFFAQRMAPASLIMPPPIPMPSPPPLHDEAKFGRVDRWRRDVVVEGKP